MDRWACVNVRAFPLQVLVVGNPGWETCPAAVVSRDTPQGTVLWINRAAREKAIRPGLRYAAALGLEPGLRAGVVSDDEVRDGIRKLANALQRFTPDVEPSEEIPGVFWLNANGLSTLFDSASAWARQIRDHVREHGYVASVSVGYSRFGSLAVASGDRGVVVFTDPHAEWQAAMNVPVAMFGLPLEAIETFELLKIQTVGDFLALPPEGIRKRFSSDVYELHRRARSEEHLPVRAYREEPKPVRQLVFEQPETDSTRVLLRLARMLHPLIKDIAARGEAIAQVDWSMVFDRGGSGEFSVRPAVPTLHQRRLLELMKLRMESVELPDGVAVLTLSVEGVATSHEQSALFQVERSWDLSAADRALARVRALFGPEAVVRAELQQAHLPEASFRWVPLERLQLPQPTDMHGSPLVRRLFQRPEPLRSHGRLVPVAGPHIISGGWWMREVHREYHFLRDEDGRLLWAYYDRRRERWFLQAEVE